LEGTLHEYPSEKEDGYYNLLLKIGRDLDARSGRVLTCRVTPLEGGHSQNKLSSAPPWGELISGKTRSKGTTLSKALADFLFFKKIP
jgi:hypothetical protein